MEPKKRTRKLIIGYEDAYKGKNIGARNFGNNRRPHKRNL